MAIHLGPPLPAASSNQPGSMGGPPLTLPYSVLLLVGFTWHPASPSDPVSSYLTLSPLPALAGGLLSVALSLGLPPLDVIQHHALWSPDFPPPFERRRLPGLLQPNQKPGTRIEARGSGDSRQRPRTSLLEPRLFPYSCCSWCSTSIRWQW